MNDVRQIPVVCFPHAGAGALYYGKWRHSFQGGVDLRIVEYPLRERRLGTPMPASVELLAGEIFAEFADVFRGTYAIWGHSMGSVIGYEVAKLCQERLDNPRWCTSVRARRRRATPASLACGRSIPPRASTTCCAATEEWARKSCGTPAS